MISSVGVATSSDTPAHHPHETGGKETKPHYTSEQGDWYYEGPSVVVVIVIDFIHCTVKSIEETSDCWHCKIGFQRAG